MIITTRRAGVVDLGFGVNAGRLIASLEGEVPRLFAVISEAIA